MLLFNEINRNISPRSQTKIVTGDRSISYSLPNEHKFFRNKSSKDSMMLILFSEFPLRYEYLLSSQDYALTH